MDEGIYDFEVGKNYKITIKWQGSKLVLPDYDYIALIEADNPDDEWMITLLNEKGEPITEDGILGDHRDDDPPGPDNTFYAEGKKAYLIINGKLEVFRDPDYLKPLDDWPHISASLPRSPKYIFGKRDPIYVQVMGLGTNPFKVEPIPNAVKVTSESGGVVYLNLIETGYDTQIFNNSAHQEGELLYLSSSNLDGTTEARIEVTDEEVLTFSLRTPPIGSPYTYRECVDVMVDRGEYAIATQKPAHIFSLWNDIRQEFEPPLRDVFKWCQNGDVKGPTDNFICQGGINSQSDIMSIAGHGLSDEEEYLGAFAMIKLNGTDFEDGEEGYSISPHEDEWGTFIGYMYWEADDEWKLKTYPPHGAPTSGGIECNWNSDMEWVILSACGVLRNDTPSSPKDGDQIFNKDVWDDTLRGLGGRPAHGLFGYSSSPQLRNCDKVVKEFFKFIKSGSTLVSSWRDAVVAVGGWFADYGIVMRADNEDDKLNEVTRDTFSTQMKYWYSVGRVPQGPISYDDIGYIASEGRKPSNVDVEIRFNPSDTKEHVSYLAGRMQTVVIDGKAGIPTRTGLQIFRYDKEEKPGSGKHLAAAEIALAIDNKFSQGVIAATCFEEEFDDYTMKVTSCSAVGKIHEFYYVDPTFPIARSMKGNFVRVLTEHGETVLVIAKFIKPLAYRATNELMISQAKAVEKLKGKLQHTHRFGPKCKVNRATLEYEDSGQTNPDGTIKLVPVWRLDVESEKDAARIYVPALGAIK